jgi:3-oxoacyl-[acyl-carrier-protein] synthase-1
MTSGQIFIQDFAVTCALGAEKGVVAESLFAAAPRTLGETATLNDGRSVPVGRVAVSDATRETRNNRILELCYAPLARTVADVRERIGSSRLGVVIGTSTSGISEGGEAIRQKLETGHLPADFSLQQQDLGDAARFVSELSGAEGPRYVVSTACTSGARAMAAGARLIRAGICDAVLCGGGDSLCDLTLNGFAALDSLSDVACNPMSANRNGLNIGEGAALFLLSREPGPFRLAGWGESADGHHMSAPDPTGAGAERAIGKALAMSEAHARDIGFVHLHGTATKLNDQMEAGVVHRLFGDNTPAASTKPLTGHTLGAAGAIQAALCLLAIEQGKLPPHIWDGVRDPELPEIRLAEPGERARLDRIVSASYAFGGNNAALVLAQA